MRAFYHPASEGHAPSFFLVRGRVAANEERAERAEKLLAGLRALGIATELPPPSGPAARAAAHSLDYLDFLETAWAEWRVLANPGPEVVANAHPRRGFGQYPSHVVGRAGWHMADTACPIGEKTWEAACAAADAAVAAAEAVRAGAREAYALCRPPGHHAYADMAGGHCFLNNAAIAAERLRLDHERIAVLDIDVHHGNGTQSIFYERRDVLTVSIHADPTAFYPFFCGHAIERGAGEGEGFNLNLPLPLGTGDAPWVETIEAAGRAIARFEPGAIVLSLGLDASENDPLRGLSVTTAGFRAAGRAVASLAAPMALVQEGGYISDDLTTNLVAFFEGFFEIRAR